MCCGSAAPPVGQRKYPTLWMENGWDVEEIVVWFYVSSTDDAEERIDISIILDSDDDSEGSREFRR